MEKRLPVRGKYFVTVFVNSGSKLPALPQYFYENGVATTCGVDADGVEQRCLADSVLPSN